MKPLINIKNYSLYLKKDKYSSFKAIDEINITIYKGEVLALIGESGSGKTITALSILQMIPKNSIEKYEGDIILYKDDAEISILNTTQNEIESIRQHDVSIIFQEPLSALNPVLTCGYQLLESIDPQNSDHKNKEFAIRLLNEVELFDSQRILRSYPHQLSGGQRQRLMIAMALARNPKLLIADEPTTALDVTVQKAVVDLLKKIQRERNLAILFITHDLDLAASIAQRVIVMYKGKIIEEGNASEVLKSPKESYTRSLTESNPSKHYDKSRLPTGKFIQKEKDYLNKNPVSSEPIIQCKAITTYYETKKLGWFGIIRNKQKITSEFNLDIYKGETLVVVGESGSGKTTLARTILKLQTPDKGEIIYNGNNIKTLKRSDLTDCQMVYQDPYSSLNPYLKIKDQFAEVIKLKHPSISKADLYLKTEQLLMDVGLDNESMEKYPHQFSGGQRQRISISRSLAAEPTFLVLDEPSAALDISIQAQVLNLLKDLKDKYQLTYFFITHNMYVARFMADKILVMKKGEIAEYGDAKNVFENPKNEYTKQLIEAVL